VFIHTFPFTAHVGVLEMDLGKPNLEQSQEVDLALAPSQTSDGHSEHVREADVAFNGGGTTDSQRTRRRWWPWLLVLCLIGAAVYGLAPRLGLDKQIEAWMPQISRVTAAVTDLLPGKGQGASQSVKPAEAPAVRAVPVVAT
jgi:hypothetical protein